LKKALSDDFGGAFVFVSSEYLDTSGNVLDFQWIAESVSFETKKKNSDRTIYPVEVS